MFDLYVVTDSDLSRGRTDAETARLAYEGGADAVQLRMKHTDGGEMLAQAREIAAMAQDDDDRYNAMKAAVEGGADYLGVGSIFKTSTKPDAVQALGLGAVFEIRQAVDVPIVAIGGINRGNIQDVIRAGADAAAVVSAVVAQEDPRAAAHELRDLILKVRPHVAPEEVPEDRSATHALRASSPFLNIYQRV